MKGEEAQEAKLKPVELIGRGQRKRSLERAGSLGL